MSYVCVLNANKQPCNPCRPAVARLLLKQGKAAVYRRAPFVIILKEQDQSPVEPLRIKVDPGSKTTGLAIVNDGINDAGKVLIAAEINHRGPVIQQSLTSRGAQRRGRRSRNTRYRKARFNNRTRPEGWLPPSLESRIANIVTWVKRYMRYCPIGAISQELVRFDMQLLENPEISGIEYQQGTLAGYEIREYLLEVNNRTCAYCRGQKIPLQVEHIIPLSRGGSNRISNLTLACQPCNQKKGNQTAEEFGFAHVQSQTRFLKDAAAVNSTRLKLNQSLLNLGLPVETGTGGRTKYNRERNNLPKAHWLDAACVGESTPLLTMKHVRPLIITATGHGSRQMCKVDKYGFPRTSAKKGKSFFGYQTGDMVRAVVTKGKKMGTYVGRVAVRASGFFDIVTSKDTIQCISYAFCKLLHKSDGYKYNY